MSNRKRNTAKPAWLQPAPKTTEEQIFGTASPTASPKAFVRDSEDNTELDLGINYQHVADGSVQRAILATDNEKKKAFLRTLNSFERLQMEMKVTAFTVRIMRDAEVTGTVITIDKMLDEAESLAAQSLYLMRQHGLSLGLMKMNEILRERFPNH